MGATENARTIVFGAITKVNTLRKKNAQIPKEEDTLLSGQNGLLNSLGLVNLIVAVEETAENLLDEEIILEPEASSTGRWAFETVGTLIERVATLLEEAE